MITSINSFIQKHWDNFEGISGSNTVWEDDNNLIIKPIKKSFFPFQDQDQGPDPNN